MVGSARVLHVGDETIDLCGHQEGLMSALLILRVLKELWHGVRLSIASGQRDCTRNLWT